MTGGTKRIIWALGGVACLALVGTTWAFLTDPTHPLPFWQALFSAGVVVVMGFVTLFTVGCLLAAGDR